jgi:hypothetical protein
MATETRRHRGPHSRKLSVFVSPWLINLCVLSWLIGVGAVASPSAAIKNTCDLITKSEMEAALGTPMRAPEPQIMGMCEYRSVGDHPFKSVRLMLGHADSRQEWEQHERGIDPDIKAVAVPGVGEAALFWNSMTGARLAVIKGKTTLSLIVDVGKLTPSIAETLPVAHHLAEIAAARMP